MQTGFLEGIMKKILLLVFIIFFTSNMHAQTNQTVIPLEKKQSIDFNYNKLMELTSLKKDPFAASIYSLIYAGAGQFYAGNYTLGSLLFLGESLYHLFNIGIRYKLQNDYGASIPFNQLSSGDRVMLISAFFGFVVLKVYSVYDANISVRKYNKEIDEKLQRFQFNLSDTDVKASLSIRF